MRSSKSRSRSKQNRSRSVGNVINRVFDSSGPEGKVRGTPQQIIDKYNQLARDAQLSNDRVAAENFMQHSEHYTRMLGEATREMESQRQSSQGDYGSQGDTSGGGQGDGQNGTGHQSGGQGGGRGGSQSNPQNGNGGGSQQGGNPPRSDQPRSNQGRGDLNRPDRGRDDDRSEQPRLREDHDDRPAQDDRRQRDELAVQPAQPELPAFLTQPAPARAEAATESFAVDGPDSETDSGLVETPENVAPAKPKTTRTRKPKPKAPEAAE